MWPFTVGMSPMPQSGGGPPLGAGGLAVGAVVGQPLAHVVDEQVGVGPDDLIVERRDVGVGAGRELGRVAGGAADLVEGLLAGRGVGRADVAPGRHGEGAGVELDLVDLVLVDLGVAAVRLAEALGLGLGARGVGHLLGGDADVVGGGLGGLVADRRHGGLPAEPAQDLLAGAGILDHVRLARRCRRRRRRRGRPRR